MTELWNNKQIVGPSFRTVPTKIKEKDLKKLYSVCKRLLKCFQDTKRFDTSAAFLSRILFINGPQFRRMEVLRRMKQTNQALLRLKNIEITSLLEDFTSYIPTEFNNEKIHLPTKQNLEYILVKLQSISKLLCRVIHCGIQAGRHCVQLVSIGNFFAKCAIFLGSLGEIVAVSKERLQTIVHLYDRLVQLKDKLKSSKTEWLPSDYVLPIDLQAWLGDSYPSEVPVEDDAMQKILAKPSLSSFIANIDDSDEESAKPEDSIVEMFKQQEDVNFENDYIEFSKTPVETCELPEATIAREETLEEKLQIIKSMNDINSFIKKEDNLRVQRNSIAFTRKISKKNWASLKHRIKSMSKTTDRLVLVQTFKTELNKLLD